MPELMAEDGGDHALQIAHQQGSSGNLPAALLAGWYARRAGLHIANQQHIKGCFYSLLDCAINP
jgi:hypothetical protein